MDELELLYARYLGLKGELDLCLIELAGLSSQQTGSESFTSDCRWCAAFFEFALSEDFVPLFNLTRKGGALNRYPFTLVSYFLAHSVRTLQWQDRVQSVATIRKSRLKHGTPLKAGEELGFAIASWIESAKEGKRDYVALGELLSKTHMLETLELEMVALAAVARQLFRQRQSRYFLMTFGKYNQLALLASGRPQFDPLSLLRDLCESPSPISKSEAAFEPKTGMLSRGLAVTGILFKVIAVLGRHRTYQIFKGSKTEQHLSSQEVIKLIDEIVAELKILKGPILKLGQFLSFYGLEFAPEQLKKLETLQDQVTPMPKATVEEMFFEEFGKSPQEIFKSFEELPFAAGSFGQVHRAISKNGEPIAVKVQYLGAREMIQTDLKNLGLLAPLFKFVMPKLKVKPLLEELAARLHEEVDYVGEAKRCQEFAQLFADEPGLKVPQVYLELSSRRILSLEYVEGMRFSAFLAAASEEKKKWACQVLSRYIARSFTSGRVNSDPNPGNFLFLEDQICLLDFGSFKLLPKNKTKVWFDLVQAAINDDICSFRRAVDGVGFAADPSKFNYEHYFDLYRRGLMSPVFENQAHRYNQQRLNNEVKLWLGISNPDRKNTDFDADFALIFRLYFGWGMLMTAIGPALNWREIFCSFLGEFALTEENQR